ncbi:MAG: BatB protein, partial [Pseudomonas sp.]
IYPIGIGADPEQTGSLGILGVNPSLDLDEPALKAIAEATGGRYFRARDGNELLKIKETLDQLEPVAQQPTQARPAQALYSAPLALALILSMLLVIQERWPDNALQRLFSKLSSKGRFLQPNPEWRERLKRLRLRRRR